MFNISNDPDGSKLILGLFCFPEIYIKRSKKVKNRSKMVFFHVFLPVSNYVSKISSPKET